MDLLGVTVKELIKPFNDITSYLKACNIVNTQYSIKNNNYQQVTETINTILLTNYFTYQIREFIHQVVKYPKEYGLNFISTISSSNEKLHQITSEKNVNTKILTPEIQKCLICEKDEITLEIRQIRFAKEAILYTRTTMGEYFS